VARVSTHETHTQNVNELIQVCTNPEHQVAVETKFCTVAPNNCVLNKNVASIALLTPGIRTLFVQLQQFVISVAVCNIPVAHIEGRDVRLRVFENMVLRRICGHKRNEVAGE
jgi:hypothetical protein